MEINQIVSIVHWIRKEFADQLSGLTEEQEVERVLDWMNNLELHYENFDSLSVIRNIRSLIEGSIPETPSSNEVDADRLYKLCEDKISSIIGDLVEEANLVIPHSKQLLEYNNLPMPPSKKQSNYFSFNLDDFPLLTPIEPILTTLRSNPWDASSLQLLLDKDCDDYIEHPMWLDIVSVTKLALMLPSNPSAQQREGCKLATAFHLQLMKSLPDIQSIDLMESVVESFICLWSDCVDASTADCIFRDDVTECCFPTDALTKMRLALMMLIVVELPNKLMLSDIRRSDGIIVAFFALLSQCKIPVKQCSKWISLPVLEVLIAGSTEGTCRSFDSLCNFLKRLYQSWPSYSVLNHLVHSGLLTYLKDQLSMSLTSLQHLLSKESMDSRYTNHISWAGIDLFLSAWKRLAVYSTCITSTSQSFGPNAQAIPAILRLLRGEHGANTPSCTDPRVNGFIQAIKERNHSFVAGTGAIAAQQLLQQQKENLIREQGNIVIPVAEAPLMNKRLYICAGCSPLSLAANDIPDEMKLLTDLHGISLCFAAALEHFIVRQEEFINSPYLQGVCLDSMHECFSALASSLNWCSTAIPSANVCQSIRIVSECHTKFAASSSQLEGQLQHRLASIWISSYASLTPALSTSCYVRSLERSFRFDLSEQLQSLVQISVNLYVQSKSLIDDANVAVLNATTQNLSQLIRIVKRYCQFVASGETTRAVSHEWHLLLKSLLKRAETDFAEILLCPISSASKSFAIAREFQVIIDLLSDFSVVGELARVCGFGVVHSAINLLSKALFFNVCAEIRVNPTDPNKPIPVAMAGLVDCLLALVSFLRSSSRDSSVTNALLDGACHELWVSIQGSIDRISIHADCGVVLEEVFTSSAGSAAVVSLMNCLQSELFLIVVSLRRLIAGLVYLGCLEVAVEVIAASNFGVPITNVNPNVNIFGASTIDSTARLIDALISDKNGVALQRAVAPFFQVLLYFILEVAFDSEEFTNLIHTQLASQIRHGASEHRVGYGVENTLSLIDRIQSIAVTLCDEPSADEDPDSLPDFMKIAQLALQNTSSSGNIAKRVKLSDAEHSVLMLSTEVPCNHLASVLTILNTYQSSFSSVESCCPNIPLIYALLQHRRFGDLSDQEIELMNLRSTGNEPNNSDASKKRIITLAALIAVLFPHSIAREECLTIRQAFRLARARAASKGVLFTDEVLQIYQLIVKCYDE